MSWQSVKKYSGQPFPGVEVKEHETRKHKGKPDLKFKIRYKINKQRFEIELGWATDGWNASKAYAEIILYKNGTKTFQPKRVRMVERELQEQVQQEKDVNTMTITEIFEEKFTPLHLENLSANTMKSRKSMFNRRIKPTMGHKLLKDITQEDVKLVVSKMNKDKLKQGTINDFLITLQSIFTFAYQTLRWNGEFPVGRRGIQVKKAQNKRTRWFRVEEANIIMNALKEKSTKVYNLAMISLCSGMRHKEAIMIKWEDVDLKSRQIIAREPKNGKPRNIVITDEMLEILNSMLYEGVQPNHYLFPRERGGERIPQPPKLFKTVLDELGVNRNISNRLEIASWHTLRHTWASWMVQNGCPLPLLMELGGWSSYEMVLRYAHLVPKRTDLVLEIFKQINLNGEK